MERSLRTLRLLRARGRGAFLSDEVVQDRAERHAHAHRVEMTLARAGTTITLTVRDDGNGFDPQRVALHPKRGIGLRNMMERMDAIGGRLDIESSEAGTAIRASIDLNRWVT